jgi:hypothetical protein
VYDESDHLLWLKRNLTCFADDTHKLLARAFTLSNFPIHEHARNVIKFGDCYRVEVVGMQSPMLHTQSSDAAHSIMMHGTDGHGVLGVLRSRSLQPRPWRSGGAGSHGCYGIGATGDTSDNKMLTIFAKMRNINKQASGVIFEVRGFLPHKAVREGGIREEATWCRRGYFTSYSSEGRWCMPVEFMTMTAIWFTPNALKDWRVLLGV